VQKQFPVLRSYDFVVFIPSLHHRSRSAVKFANARLRKRNMQNITVKNIKAKKPVFIQTVYEKILINKFGTD
jgi:hypothetical protein